MLFHHTAGSRLLRSVLGVPICSLDMGYGGENVRCEMCVGKEAAWTLPFSTVEHVGY
jgi:hypothetical protein